MDDRQISFLRQPEPPRVQIKDNPVLEKMANRLLEIHDRRPELFNGISMGQITRQLYAEILWEDGIQRVIPSDKKHEFLNVILKSPESEVINRALRYCVNTVDEIRLPARVIQDAERKKMRISSSLKGK